MQDITFELTFADQVRASRAIFRRQPTMWVSFALFAVLLIWLLWTDYQTVSQGRRVHWNLTAMGVATVAIGALFVYFSPNLTVWSYRRGNKLIAGPHTYSFLADHLSMESPLASTDIAWPAIREVREDADFFLFFISKTQAAVLPKRELQAHDLAELRTSLKAWCGEAARLEES